MRSVFSSSALLRAALTKLIARMNTVFYGCVNHEGILRDVLAGFIGKPHDTCVCQISDLCKFGDVGILLPRKDRTICGMQVPNLTHTLGGLETLPNPDSYDAHGKIFALSIFG